MDYNWQNTRTPRNRSGASAGSLFRATSGVIKFINVLVLVSVVLFAFIPLALNIFAGIKFTEVLTGSMEPTIMTHDLIVTKPVVAGEIKQGDIVGINREVSVIHRVIARDEDGVLTTKGDNNPVADGVQPTEADLWGVFVAIVPQPLATVLSRYTTTPEWRLMFGHVITGNGGSWDDLHEGMPWGSIGSVAAMIFTSIVSLLMKLAAFVQRRRESKLQTP